MKHRPTCKCPACEVKNYMSWEPAHLPLNPLIRRLLRERAALYRLMADALEKTALNTAANTTDSMKSRTELYSDNCKRTRTARLACVRLVARERRREKQ